MESRDVIVLEKIIEYCNRIEQYLERHNKDYSAFANDSMFQDACCMCVVQIGELSAVLSDDIKQLNDAIPWRIIISKMI